MDSAARRDDDKYTAALRSKVDAEDDLEEYLRAKSAQQQRKAETTAGTTYAARRRLSTGKTYNPDDRRDSTYSFPRRPKQPDAANIDEANATVEVPTSVMLTSASAWARVEVYQ